MKERIHTHSTAILISLHGVAGGDPLVGIMLHVCGSPSSFSWLCILIVDDHYHWTTARRLVKMG
jgi:hypothetical protein